MTKKVIWKQPIPIADLTSFEMPKGAEILCVKEQHGLTTLWFTCDPDAEKVMRAFAIVPTGGEMPSGKTHYIGTVLKLGGALVWHVFEIL